MYQFDHELAANLIRCGNEKLCQFVISAKYDYDTVRSLQTQIYELRNIIFIRESEIALLKEELLKLEEPNRNESTT